MTGNAGEPDRSLRPLIIGPFGPAQVACLRSWRALGAAPAFIQTEGPASPWGIARLAQWYAYRSLASLKTAEGIAWLTGFLTEQRISGLTCVADDLAIWLLEHVPLPAPCAFWLGDLEVLKRLQVKSLQVEAARRAGFRLLATYLVSRIEDVAAVPLAAYPVVVRPDEADAVQPVFKVETFDNPAEVRRFVASRTSIAGPLVVQPFRRGPNLLVHGYRNRLGTVEGYASFLVPRKYQGVGVEIRGVVNDAAIIACCRRFVESAGLTGVFHFDLLRDDASGEVYFLEVNARLGGTTGKVYAIGFDEPGLLLKVHGQIDMPEAPPSTSVGRSAFNLQAFVRYLIAAAGSRLQRIDYPVVGAASAVIGLTCTMVTEREEIGLFRHPLSSLSYHCQKLRSKV